MPDAPYTQLRPKQFRGPTHSDDFNSQNEEVYRDMTTLYNRSNFTQQVMIEGYRRFAKEQISLQKVVDDLESRVKALESTQHIITFHSDSQIDNDRFIGSPYEIPSVSANTSDSDYGVIVLPRVVSSSQSKLAFTNDDGVPVVPSTLETNVVGINSTADFDPAVIDTSEPEFAIARRAGRIWERNVVVNAPNGSGAECFLYLKAPLDLFTTDKSNVIVLNPFPTHGMDILDIAYTTDLDFALDGTANYTNFPAIHVSDTDGIGYIPPGSWGNTGDIDNNAGPREYVFDPVPMTGLRLKLRQRNYFHEGSKYIYSYGLSNLDVRYDKFLSTGKSLIRFDAPVTISSVRSVEPDIWNVAEAEISDIFSWRAIWETSYNSGVYTTTPVPSSKRVWIEVTLSMTSGGGSPSMSGLSLTYS